MTGNLPVEAVDGTKLTTAIDVYAIDGTPRTIELTFASTGGGGWEVTGTDGTLDATGADEVKVLKSFAVGSVASKAGKVTFKEGVEYGALGVELDFSAVTGFAKNPSVEFASQDGYGAGTLQSFSMNADGTLIGSFSNGQKEPVGRVALANFANAAGLEKAGSTAFRGTVNSGEAQVGTAGTGGRGSLGSRALEMSNVDLSQEFTNLIIAQRGFQAGSRVITTSDELLQELVNLKR
ncbi:flagellar hook-basal body complex protein [Georgenia yuyongxinii]